MTVMLHDRIVTKVSHNQLNKEFDLFLLLGSDYVKQESFSEKQYR